jgi:hypothetical protein
MSARDPHAPNTRNCGCAVEAGVSISGVDSVGIGRFLADWDRAHGPDGCGAQQVDRAESSMGRKVKAKQRGAAA